MSRGGGAPNTYLWGIFWGKTVKFLMIFFCENLEVHFGYPHDFYPSLKILKGYECHIRPLHVRAFCLFRHYRFEPSEKEKNCQRIYPKILIYGNGENKTTFCDRRIWTVFFRHFCFENQFKPLIDSNHINVDISLILFIPNGIFVTFARNTQDRNPPKNVQRIKLIVKKFLKVSEITDPIHRAMWL